MALESNFFSDLRSVDLYSVEAQIDSQEINIVVVVTFAAKSSEAEEFKTFN